MAEPLAYLIGRREYPALRWAMERTRRVSAPIAESDDDDIAEVLEVAPRSADHGAGLQLLALAAAYGSIR